MRNVVALWMIGLSSLLSGCQLAENAVHNLTYETKLKSEEIAENCRYKKLAQEHWQRIQQTHSEKIDSKDYADGFKEGFIDLIVYGGNGQPPFVPPQHYWGPRYRTPEGYQAVQDWYAGFRHGAAVAQDSGYRQFAIVPSSLNVTSHGDTTSPDLARNGKNSPNPDFANSSPSGKDLPKKQLLGKQGVSAFPGDTAKTISNSMTQPGITWGKANSKHINHEKTEVPAPLDVTGKSLNLGRSVLQEPVSHQEQITISTQSQPTTSTGEDSQYQMIRVPPHPNTEENHPSKEDHSKARDEAQNTLVSSKNSVFPVDEPRARLHLSYCKTHPVWRLGNPVSISSDQILTFPQEMAAPSQGIQGSVIITE